LPVVDGVTTRLTIVPASASSSSSTRFRSIQPHGKWKRMSTDALQAEALQRLGELRPDALQHLTSANSGLRMSGRITR
jgi:hypothetical protein